MARIERLLFASAILATLAGCGGTSTAPSQPAAPPAAGAATAPSAAPAAAPKQLQKVVIADSVDTLSFAPIWVAQEQGYFKDAGLDVQIPMMGGGGPAVEAVVSGSAQFVATDTTSVLTAKVKGVDLINVETPVDSLTLDLTVRDAVIDRLHLSRSMPVVDRIKALKGVTFGPSSAGAASDVFAQYWLRLAGLDPKKDARFAYVGGTDTQLAAMRSGQVDVIIASPPAGQQAELQNVGKIIISGGQGDVPELTHFPYEGVITTPAYAKAHPDVVKAVASAIARGGNLMHDDPKAALAALQKHYGKLDAKILQGAVEEITPAVPRNGRSTEDGWTKLLGIDRQAGVVKPDAAFDLKEGALWTNDYLPR